jgi:hypothetical protein
LLSRADDSYSHQIVAPAAATAYVDPAWAERCWHVVYLGDGWIAGIGRGVWPHGGRRTARAGLNTGDIQFARRTEEPFVPGDDPNRGDVGLIRIETIEPLCEFRLVVDEPGLPFGFDLIYRARFAPVATDRNLIERDGAVLTDYMNFFQSGIYSGVVHADGEERTIAGRAGFRDRGWGLRKHEGAAKRGFHISCCCEFEDEALYVLLYETGSAKRVFTNGWLMNDDGVAETVVAAEHDLKFDGTHLLGGSVSVEFESGATREVVAAPEGSLWIGTLGYTADPVLAAPGADRFDLTDAETRARLDGVYEAACTYQSNGAVGYGFFETGLGIHARYRPE